MSVNVHYLTELKPTLACQEKAAQTKKTCLFSGTPCLSNSVSSNSFCLKLCFCTHIHKHTCSPHSAKRERWLVNKQWHSAHSVTRLGFDQHRCSCSPQPRFLSFYLPNLFHSGTQTRAHAPTYSLVFVGLDGASPVFTLLRFLSLYLNRSLTQQAFELVPFSGQCCVLEHTPSHILCHSHR